MGIELARHEEVLRRLDCLEKMLNDIGMVDISKLEYERLKEREDWLQCLEAAGVDNWQGMEEAIKIHNAD